MLVNKIRINTKNKNGIINLPLSLKFNGVGKYDVLKTHFIKKEVEKSINKTIDYEKTRFSPIGSQIISSTQGNTEYNKITDIIIKLNFLDKNNNMILETKYSDIGFVDNDIKFRKDRFLKSFLTLKFYDNDILTNQNLISFITLFPTITVNEITQFIDLTTGEPIDGGGLPIHANKFPVRFVINNIGDSSMASSEGFYLYHLKNEVKIGSLPKELYMRAEFNNSGNGKSTRFITVNNKLDINSLLNKLHTRYLLIRTNSGFYYKLDSNYNNATNITENNNKTTINLYEIQVI